MPGGSYRLVTKSFGPLLRKIVLFCGDSLTLDYYQDLLGNVYFCYCYCYCLNTLQNPEQLICTLEALYLPNLQFYHDCPFYCPLPVTKTPAYSPAVQTNSVAMLD